MFNYKFETKKDKEYSPGVSNILSASGHGGDVLKVEFIYD